VRLGFVAVGVVVIVLGAVLMYEPLVPQASPPAVTENSPYYANLTGFSPFGGIPGTVAWSANQTVEVGFFTCDKVTGDLCTGANSTSFENGTSGTFSFSVPSGGLILFGIIPPSSASVSLTIKLAEVTIGFLLIIVGALLLILGLVLRRKPVPVVAPPPAEPVHSPP
jgi:hypothetical protein